MKKDKKSKPQKEIPNSEIKKISGGGGPAQTGGGRPLQRCPCGIPINQCPIHNTHHG